MDKMGTKLDARQRIKLARVDNLHFRSTISDAREKIYKQNCAVDSTMVDDLLKNESFVPTEVRKIVFMKQYN